MTMSPEDRFSWRPFTVLIISLIKQMRKKLVNTPPPQKKKKKKKKKEIEKKII